MFCNRKGNDVLVKTSVVIDNQSAVYDDLTFDNVAVIADALMEKFISGDYDKIELIYNQFKNAATQIVQTEQFYHWQYNQI
jgi:F-type H+-transporting ATPase subunit gamma